MANLQRGKAYGSRDYEDALASYFHHRREQRIICSWHHRGARVLPDRVKRAVPHRRRDRPTCRKPTLPTGPRTFTHAGFFSGHRLLSDRATDPFPCQSAS